MTDKIKEDGDQPDDEESFVFDPTSAVDAGVGEEMQAADKEAKVIVLRNVENRSRLDQYAEQVREEPDLTLRARRLLQGNLVTFPDTKKTADGYIALNCDKNRITAFEALFGEGPTRPHINTFSGRLVDSAGDIIDDQYSMVPMLHALHAMGLRQQSLESIRKSLRDWGLQIKTNDLITKFNATIPEWDGTPRLETKLIDLFASFDTDTNRSFGKYFWLSIYCRITKPGCLAPMALALFGGQNAGKSYFSKLICQTLLQDEDAISVQLDIGANKIDFLRDITGHSIVANIGEMTGFNRSDLNDIKQFMTATSDSMHQKFEGHFQQQRQWISIMDGNKYEGLQRDDTGNRRFYPQFVGQLADKHGQPNWDVDFKVDFSGFEAELWQIMSECRIWIEEHTIKGYVKYVDEVSTMVKNFSQNEMAKGRGQVADYSLDTYLVPALMSLAKLNAEIVKGSKYRGVWITTAAIKTRIKMMSRGGEVKDNHLKARMITFGATAEMIRNVRGYLFTGIMDEGAYVKHIGGAETDDDVEVMAKFEDQGDF
jgi:Virulence-associated protein E